MPIAPAVQRVPSPLLLIASLAAAACKAGTEPLPPAAVQLGIAVTPAATAQSGVTLSPQPVVELEDAEGHAFAQAGSSIVAVLATPGGTLTGTLSVKTDAAGRAVFSDLAISGGVGAWRLRFDSPGLRSVTSNPIQLSAGLAALLTAASGNLQTSVAGTPVAQAPVVRVTDGSGNPVSGVPVEFAASAGGSVEGASTITSAEGNASPTRWTLATTIGLNTLTATSSAIPGAEVSFTATGTVGPPALLIPVLGDGQTATVGGSVVIAPAVKLTDAAGHVLPGVVVSFTAGSGGAVTLGNPLTDADGIATVGGWSLGLVPGDHTLTASRLGVPSVTFHASGTIFPVQALAAGDAHSCALDPSGTAFCWGSNSSGQLGHGAGANDSLPKAVSGALGFATIGAGSTHSCALLASGDAYCWGANEAGQLGDGTTTPRSVPTAVAGGFKFSAIEPSTAFTCGLLLDGTVRCWGLGADGQLGDGAQTSRSLPTLVTGGHLFSAISTGGADACGLESSGMLFCWGSNAFGRLGDGTTSTRLVPTAVSGAISFMSVSAGSTHTCGVAISGAAYCWGRGLSGRLGTGTLTDQLSPAAISGGLSLSAISASAGQSCALTTAGQAYCWGFNGSGELGDGTFTNRLVPTAVQAGGLSFTAIVAGSERTCARSSAGGAYCWGRNDTGAVGDGTFIGRQKPVGVVKP